MPDSPRWFDAQFTDGTRRFTVGPFDTPQEAHDWGTANATPELRYTGIAQRVGRQEHTKVAAHLALKGSDQEGKRHVGVVTRWEPGATQGFITDTTGTSWFVSRDSLPDGRASLPVDTRVTFAGSHNPAPGKRYPQAYSVTPDGRNQ